MTGSEESRSRSTNAMAPHRWRSARILESVCQVNEHLVSALIELAASGTASTLIVSQNADVLRRFDVSARRRVARIPVLLLDLHFQDGDWWSLAGRTSGDHRATRAVASDLPMHNAAELTRESLIVAWLAAQHARQSTTLLFGMSDAAANCLGELTPQQLNLVAERSSHELSIRWQSKPEFWRRLLVAGQSGSANDLCEAHLCGLQLLGGDLLTVS
jgi:hypothetical protein